MHAERVIRDFFICCVNLQNDISILYHSGVLHKMRRSIFEGDFCRKDGVFRDYPKMHLMGVANR